jgi:hypothetical protein
MNVFLRGEEGIYSIIKVNINMLKLSEVPERPPTMWGRFWEFPKSLRQRGESFGSSRKASDNVGKVSGVPKRPPTT